MAGFLINIEKATMQNDNSESSPGGIQESAGCRIKSGMTWLT